MDNEHHLLVRRRRLLRLLEAAYPALSETEELLEAIPLAAADQIADEVRCELKCLLAWGWIENVRGDSLRPPWWRITGEGLAQINKEAAKLDPRVWGKLAY